ncbi:MAG: hypothetical protein JWQ71_154 [Pedosphaera sp.]|nr:hypothetical protein [Pedosphaera sp.]
MTTPPIIAHVSLAEALLKGPPPVGNLVARGKGMFFDGTQNHSVEAGSFLFVPAGQIHRFEAFSPDFAVWVLFYGPEGGEANVVNTAPS